MTPREVAFAFAPVFAHQVTREWEAADSITSVELSGHIMLLRDNPRFLLENTDTKGKWGIPTPEPVIYYSVCETSTHFLLLYAAYHPMDWYKRAKPDNLFDIIRDAFDEHTHDMEGALLVVRKEPDLTLDAVITVAHLDFYLYSEPMIPTGKGEAKPWGSSLRVQKFSENVDGHVWIDAGAKRCKLYVQSRGHGIYGDHKRWGGGDYVCNYYPMDSIPPEPIAPVMKTVQQPYRLVDIFEEDGLWAHRYDSDVFRQRADGRWGYVAYEKITTGNLVPASANPPWSWNDRDDPSPVGEIATDPAGFINRYAQCLGPVSLNYISNPYWL